MLDNAAKLSALASKINEKEQHKFFASRDVMLCEEAAKEIQNLRVQLAYSQENAEQLLQENLDLRKQI